MESARQMMGAMFIALGDAGGPAVLARACSTLTKAVEAGAIPDAYARKAIQALVESCDPNHAAVA
jgi:hypothetical protein